MVFLAWPAQHANHKENRSHQRGEHEHIHHFNAFKCATHEKGRQQPSSRQTGERPHPFAACWGCGSRGCRRRLRLFWRGLRAYGFTLLANALATPEALGFRIKGGQSEAKNGQGEQGQYFLHEGLQ
jgi:hypothetical protein